MSDIAYIVTLSPNHALNEYLTSDFDLSLGEQWHPFSNAQNSRVSDGLVYRLTNNLPVSTAPRQIRSVLAQGFVDDFYHRIHIDKIQADLGVVASKQVINFALWNAYFEPLDLKRIDGLTAGVYFDNHDLPPLTLYALEERTWTLNVLPDGDARLNLIIKWLFEGQDTKRPYRTQTHLNGQRVIGFAWLIDWDKGVNESLAWHTDILQSQTGYEQRRSLRLAPRQTLDVNLLLHGQERTLFDLAMTAWASKAFVVPMWFYQSYLMVGVPNDSRHIPCDTAQIPYGNFQYIMLIKDAFSYEVGEIEQITPTHIVLKRPLQHAWQKGTQIFPAVSAQLNGLPRLTKHSSQVMRTTVSFLATGNTAYLMGTPKIDVFRGNPVLSIAPNEVDNLTHSYERLQQQLDNLSGCPLLVDSANASFSLFQYRWFLAGSKQHQAFYAWLNLLNGRQKAVWLPTFSDDLQLVKAISGTRLEVANCGYTKFGQGQNGRQFVQIELTNGERFYRKVISSEELGTHERLTLDESFLHSISPSLVKRISFISLCRLNSDTVNIVHHNDVAGLSTAEMTFRGIRE